MIIVRTTILGTKKLEEKMKEGYKIVCSSKYMKGKFSISENYRGFIEYILEKDPNRGENFLVRTYLKDKENKKEIKDLGNVKLISKTEVPENQETYGYIEYIFEKILTENKGEREEKEKELSYPITER